MSDIYHRTRECKLFGLTESELEKDISLLPEDMGIHIKNALKAADELPAYSQSNSDFVYRRITKLCNTDSDASGQRENSVPDLIRLLAACGEPFSVTLEGGENAEMSLVIGRKSDGNSDNDIFRKLLRAVYPVSDASAYTPKERGKRTSWAVCRKIYNNNDEVSARNSEGSEAGWIEMLGRACAGLEFSVTMSFSPLDAGWLNKQLTTAESYADKFSRYRESNLQSSGNNNINPREMGNLANKVVVFLGGENVEVQSSGVSLSSEKRSEHNSVIAAYDKMTAYADILRSLRDSTGCCVSICVDALDSAAHKMICAIMESALYDIGYSCTWSGYEPAIAFILPSDRLNEAGKMPAKPFPGLVFEQSQNLEINPPAVKDGVPRINIGNSMWNGEETKVPMYIPLNQLNRHAFICGMTGSGKSNTVCSLLASMKDIPFLVIEPVKGEYWSLGTVTERSVEVYNMDTGSDNRLSFNPFWFPKGGNLSYHIAGLKNIISAAFDLYAAMPDILAQCLYSVYTKKGWEIGESRNLFEGLLPDEMLYPTFSSLCNEVELYIDRSDFSERLKGDYKGSLLSRLQSFTTGTRGILLNTTKRPCLEKWIKEETSCVLELEALADDSDKAVVMGTILHQYFQCVRLFRQSNASDSLKHIIVIEEAHHLFKDSESANGTDNSRQHLVETLKNILAEIRAYGEGIFIVDQSPTGVSDQVVKNTAVKIVHRIDYGEDLRALQSSLLLDDNDFSAPAALECGYALVRYGSMKHPIHVHIPRCEEKEKGGIHSSTQTETTDKVPILMNLLLVNDDLRIELEKACKKFLNHFLFDTLQSCRKALAYYIGTIDRMLKRLGYMSNIISSETHSKDFVDVIFSMIERTITKEYPDQYLVCGLIRTAAERFVAIERGRSDEGGIRQGEWYLIDNSRKNISRLLKEVHKNSENVVVRTYADKLNNREERARLICELVDEWNKRKAANEELWSSYSKEQRFDILLERCFFFEKYRNFGDSNADDEFSNGLKKYLWGDFQYFLDNEEKMQQINNIS